MATSDVAQRKAVYGKLQVILARDVPYLFTGTLLIEIVFSWPGEGRLFYDALRNRDYSVLMGVLLVTAALILLSNLLADLVYAWLNPRIRYD